MGKEKCEEHSGCMNQLRVNEKNITILFESVEKIKNRPPVWMSLAFAAALGAIGWLIKGL